MFKKWEGFFLAAAFLSFVLANALYFGWIEGANRQDGIFVGHWVTSILVALTYLRLTTHAHESRTKTHDDSFKVASDEKWYRPSDGLTRVLPQDRTDGDSRQGM